ncbi:MAG: hypothetical protein AB7P07_06465 [Hyphomonadaceae bacterium]
MLTAARTIMIAAMLGASFTGAAYARDQVFTARLAAPAAESRIIVQNSIWNCEGETCVARADHASTVRACRQLVRELGAAVLAYGPEGAQLSDDELNRCNADVAPRTQQAQNQD